MDANGIEQALYERAVKTKIRAPRAERMANLGYNRVVTSSVIAVASLICTLSLTTTNAVPVSNDIFGDATVHPQQMTKTDPADGSITHPPIRLNQTSDPAIALAMAPAAR